VIRLTLNVEQDKLDKIHIPTKLTQFERTLLNELCQVLEPFESESILIQKEKLVSASLAIPTTLQLKHKHKI
jgi:hypothetical protein